MAVASHHLRAIRTPTQAWNSHKLADFHEGISPVRQAILLFQGQIFS